jgi:hypothetical protein
MLDAQNVRVLSELDKLAALIAEFKAYIATLEAWAKGDGPELLAERVAYDA